MKAIVYCSNEDELLLSICRSAVVLGKLKMAWIGMIDGKSKMVRPVVSFGFGTEYLDKVEMSLDDNFASGRGPSATACRENRAVWIQDWQNDASTGPWKECAARYDWCGAATLPLLRDGVVVAVFHLYAGEANAFDEPAQKLLTEMASDISFALTNFKREALRKLSEAQLIIAGKVFDQSSEGFIVTDSERNIISVNRAFTEITGYSELDVMGKNPRILCSGPQS